MAVPYSRFIIGAIPWYSALIVLGILFAVLLGQGEEKRLALPRDTMVDATLVAVPCGIIGARLYYVVMEWPSFAGNPLSVLYVWQGGIAIYGAVIGGALGLWLYYRKKTHSFGNVMDMIAPGLLLAQAVGRWGNYFNQEAFGPVIGNPLFQWFPLGVQILENGVYVWHMAAFFYEFLWNVCGVLALLFLRRGETKPGNLFLWYLLLYGSGRFIIEQLRMDSLWLFGFRVSQWVGLLTALGAGGALLYKAARNDQKLFFIVFAALLAAALRWLCLSSWIYGLCLILCVGLAMLAKIRLRFYGILALCLDITAFVVSLLLSVSQGFGGYFHALVCSLTFPLYGLWLVSGVEETAKGEAQCPSEL